MLTVLRLTLASTGSAHRAPSLTFMTEDAPQRDHSLRPPLSPPAGGKGGARADHGHASQRPRSSASAGFADRRRPTAHGGGALGIMRRGAPVRCAEPAEGRTMQSPPLSPPRRGGKGGGDCIVRASTIAARGAGARPPPFPPAGGQGGAGGGAASGRAAGRLRSKVREGATKARSSSLTSLG